MTRTSPPTGHLWRPLPPWLRVGQSFPRIGTPMTVAGTSMPRATRPKNRVPKRLTPKLKWMKGVKMTEIFRSTGKCRTFEAFLPCRLRPPSQVEALAGSTAQRAANEDDPGFDPPAGHLWRPLPRWLRVGQSFPWIGTPMTVAGTSMPPAPLRLGRFSLR